MKAITGKRVSCHSTRLNNENICQYEFSNLKITMVFRSFVSSCRWWWWWFGFLFVTGFTKFTDNNINSHCLNGTNQWQIWSPSIKWWNISTSWACNKRWQRVAFLITSDNAHSYISVNMTWRKCNVWLNSRGFLLLNITFINMQPDLKIKIKFPIIKQFCELQNLQRLKIVY